MENMKEKTSKISRIEKIKPIEDAVLHMQKKLEEKNNYRIINMDNEILQNQSVLLGYYQERVGVGKENGINTYEYVIHKSELDILIKYKKHMTDGHVTEGNHLNIALYKRYVDDKIIIILTDILDENDSSGLPKYDTEVIISDDMKHTINIILEMINENEVIDFKVNNKINHSLGDSEWNYEYTNDSLDEVSKKIRDLIELFR